MPIVESFCRLTRIGLHKTCVRVPQAHRQEVDLALDPADDAQRFAKIHLGMARRMCEGHKHLPLSLAGAADVVLHDRNPAREAMLVT